MAIDNNLYEKSIKILTDLIGFQTVSGTDNSELINYCEKILNDLGIETFKVFDDENVWTGEITVNIIMDKNSSLDKRSQLDLMHLGQMVAGTLGLMEQDRDLVHKLEKFVDKQMQQEKEKIISNTKDNVIYIDFKEKK